MTWIKVEDRLPNKMQLVLVYVPPAHRRAPGFPYHFGYRRDDGLWTVEGVPSNVRAWMELSPPED